MLRGFPSRLEKEIKQLYMQRTLKTEDPAALDKIKIKIDDKPNRNYAVYAGGSTLSDIKKNSQGFWIHREEYLEKGMDRVVKEKCVGMCSTSYGG